MHIYMCVLYIYIHVYVYIYTYIYIYISQVRIYLSNIHITHRSYTAPRNIAQVYMSYIYTAQEYVYTIAHEYYKYIASILAT